MKVIALNEARANDDPEFIERLLQQDERFDVWRRNVGAKRMRAASRCWQTSADGSVLPRRDLRLHARGGYPTRTRRGSAARGNVRRRLRSWPGAGGVLRRR